MKKQSLARQSEAGYTLLELLVIVIMVGVLAAIAAPGWLAFLNRQRLNAAQNQASTLMRDAHVNAQREKLRWQVCFNDNGNEVLYSVHRVPSDNNCLTTNLESLIGQDSKSIRFTSNMNQNPNGFYRIQFNYDGSVEKEVSSPWRITFTSRVNSGSKACVTVETLLGAINLDKDDKCN